MFLFFHVLMRLPQGLCLSLREISAQYGML